jgi:LacI family transcriptional regulator
MTISLTIEQIAEIAQVSRSTVSRVLNNQPNVRPAVRERVQQVMREHNYAPHAAARSLASNSTNIIAVVIPRSASTIFSEPFFPLVIQGITEACNEQSYFLMLAMITTELEQDFYNRIVRGRHFDGIIMLSSDVDDPILPLLIKDQTRLVLIGRHPYFQDLTWVDGANAEGAHAAVTHLVNLGHRRIATIAGPLQMAVSMDRRDGYKRALLEAGLAVNPQLIIEGDFSQESGYQAMARLLSLPERPTAVFTASDSMAVGALRAVREAGLTVPNDLALVSFDDLPVAAFADPPLTTVHQPVPELGAKAVELLIEQIKRPEQPPRQVRLPTRLVVRRSCGSV